MLFLLVLCCFYYLFMLFLLFASVAFKYLIKFPCFQFVVFKLVSYCFEETIGLDIKALFTRPSLSHIIKPGDKTKEF